MGDRLSRVAGFLSELRRRRIYHVVAAYAAAVFIVAQAAALAVDALDLPDAVLTFIVVVGILGFPIALVLAWAFQVTPEGVRRAEPMAEEGAEAGGSRHMPRIALVAATVVFTAAVGWVAWKVWLPGGSAAEPLPAGTAARPDLDPTRIAVLYLDDHTPGQELRYFADGLTESLIHELSQVEALDVISRNGVKPYREGDVGLDSLVRALEVGSLVEGSVRRAQDTVRVTVQIIDGRTGAHLESAEIERPWAERLELQDDLAESAAGIIRRALGVEVRLRERRAETDSPEAWTLVQEAERLRDQAERLGATGDSLAGRRALDAADSVLARAATLDSGWVEPLVLRGWVAIDRARLATVSRFGHDPREFRRGLAIAEEALRSAPDDPGALELRGILRYRLSQSRGIEDPDALRTAAERDLDRAVAADPSRARAWGALSELYADQGRFAEAKLAAERALEEDAFLREAERMIMGMYQASLDLEELEEARRWCERGRERFPQEQYFVACALFMMGLPGGPAPDVGVAWRLYDSLLARSTARERARERVYGQLLVAATLARAAARDTAARDRLPADSARAILGRALTDVPEQLRPFSHYYAANVLLHLGQREEALSHLTSYLEALPGQRAYLASDWMFRALWEDPRFQALIRGEGEG